ncbi:MAG: glycoside hydrolase family 2 protein [Sphingobacteriales bacterium]|nr:glycoside hydrolase family 2 protein [Sphingobacteriales bacterium]
MNFFQFRTLLICLLLSTSVVSSAQNNAANRNRLFDANWRFIKDSTIDASGVAYDDIKWRTLDLPHDWSIEDLPNQSDSVVGPFTTKSIGTTATGYTVGGICWYRKHFTFNNIANKRVTIYFDGVYMNSDVWINGHHLGTHAYGYTPFYYDLTPYLKQNGENILAVRVRNEGKNSRWYSGSGIYRHVWLTVTNPVHIEQWGVYITTPKVSEASAAINIQTSIINDEQKVKSLKLRTSILDAKNNIVGKTETPVSNSTNQSIALSNPHLWSPESPYLYHAVTDVMSGDKIIDHVVTNFGIRSINITADKGFLLNGKPVELKGGCVHHDNGPLGSATIDRAEERRVELLKQFGYNAVRLSHNPPSMQFLDACDRLGLIVIDEAFDQWQRHKNPDDYGLYFDTCWQPDIDAMVLRDRNHPSVIFWSIGNEINERADSSGIVITKTLHDEVKRLDDTRPVTEAICFFWDHPKYKWDTTAAAYALLDVGGYNYQMKEYEKDHAKFPQRIMMGTESFPLQAFENWQLVEQHPYVIGDFVWTAMDYLGETGIGHTSLDNNTKFTMDFPWFNAFCGDIDLIGGKKPQSYYRDVVWNKSKLEMLVHTPIPEGHKEAVSFWGWGDEVASYTFPGAERKLLQVHVYTRYDSVRLVLNGKTIGVQAASAETKLTATFNINYEPGVLKAIGLKNGKAVDSIVLKTAGKPAGIRLLADRKKIHANPNDLAYVTAEVVDANGNLVPDAAFLLHFSVSGNGKIIATGNANPSGVESMQQPQHKTFKGKCLAIVQPKGASGNIILKATGDGLTSAQIVISTK